MQDVISVLYIIYKIDIRLSISDSKLSEISQFLKLENCFCSYGIIFLCQPRDTKLYLKSSR